MTRPLAAGTAGIVPARAATENAKPGRTPAVGRLILPDVLRGQLAAAAAQAFPRECCGLIEGRRRGDRIEACALHATRNLADADDRFAIDPAEHIRLLRALRGTDRAIVGCYHSHPNGTAAPSPRDRDGAADEDFVWLIAAVAPDGSVDVAAHLFAAGDFRRLVLA